jgi:VanZ family protein
MEPRHSPLARYLLAVYWLLVVYGSLYPFSGWRDQGLSPFEFLGAPLPRYFTAFDVAVNLAAYFPLGFLAVLAFVPRLRVALACLAATLLAAATSLGLEALQTYLPDRIPSNLDFALNVAGGLAGALAGLTASDWFVGHRGLRALRHRLFRPGHGVDLGLVLAALWVFSQLNPETLLFGNGDLRDLFHAPPAELYAADTFARVEAGVAGANALAATLFLALLVNAGQPVRLVVLVLIAVAVATRTAAFAILLDPREALTWLTPGASAGLAIGVIAALLSVRLPRSWAVAGCGLALMAATALVNLAPENPYLAQSLAAWPQSHFLNFNGLTRLVSALWPFAAVVYLLAVAGTGTRGGVVVRNPPAR